MWHGSRRHSTHTRYRPNVDIFLWFIFPLGVVIQMLAVSRSREYFLAGRCKARHYLADIRLVLIKSQSWKLFFKTDNVVDRSKQVR